MKGNLVEQKKETGLQNERAHWIPDKINFKKAHIWNYSREISEHQGDRVPLLNLQFETTCCQQSQEHRLALDFSFATLEAMRQRNSLQIFEERECDPRIPNPTDILFLRANEKHPCDGGNYPRNYLPNKDEIRTKILGGNEGWKQQWWAVSLKYSLYKKHSESEIDNERMNKDVTGKRKWQGAEVAIRISDKEEFKAQHIKYKKERYCVIFIPTTR